MPSSSGVLSRRKFLVTTSIALAGMHVDARRLSASTIGRGTANAFLPEPLHTDLLSALATRALDAAQSAGAQYADIRISQQQTVSISLLGGVAPSTTIGATFSYGLRVIVDGVLAFDYGNVPTADAVAASARNAVAQARGGSTVTKDRVELAPTSAVTGEWASAFQIDPFAVPILEQADLLGAFVAAASRIEGAMSSSRLNWQREIRVYASSEGTHTRQTFLRARPSMFCGSRWLGSVSFPFPGLLPKLAGYECIIGGDLQQAIKAYAEEVQRYARLPATRVDVGRYPIVLDGASMAMVMTLTLGPALQMDRVLGYEADASGSSFMAPPADVLGVPLLSPLVSITADRPLTNICGAQWDDEGVVPEPVRVIAEGHVMDYLTDRQTAPALQSWYARRDVPYRSHGYAMASQADRSVMIGNGHLTMNPGAGGTVDELCRDLAKGLLVVHASYVGTDQQLASGYVGGGLLLEVRNGKVVRRIRDAGIQFKTVAFWKLLTALGGTQTVQSCATQLYKGQPWQVSDAMGSAPAGHFKDVNVMQVGLH